MPLYCCLPGTSGIVFNSGVGIITGHNQSEKDINPHFKFQLYAADPDTKSSWILVVLLQQQNINHKIALRLNRTQSDSVSSERDLIKLIIRRIYLLKHSDVPKRRVTLSALRPRLVLFSLSIDALELNVLSVPRRMLRVGLPQRVLRVPQRVFASSFSRHRCVCNEGTKC